MTGTDATLDTALDYRVYTLKSASEGGNQSTPIVTCVVKPESRCVRRNMSWRVQTRYSHKCRIIVTKRRRTSTTRIYSNLMPFACTCSHELWYLLDAS